MLRRFRPSIAGLIGRPHHLSTIVGITVVCVLLTPGTSVLAGAGGSAAGAGGPAAGAGGSAASAFPSVRLIRSSATVTVGRIPGQPIYADPGIYVGPRGGAWQVDIRRPNYGPRFVATQVGRSASGKPVTRVLPSGLVKGLAGLDGFFRVSIRDAKGVRITEQRLPFCPAGSDQRTDGSGPLQPRYPRICYLNPFARGSVIGIDKGWATSALGYSGIRFSGPNGAYHLKLTVTKEYRNFFGIPKEDAVTNVTLRVEREGGCGGSCGPDLRGVTSPNSSSTRRGPTPAPTVSAPPASTLPDLVALPAWNIATESFGRRDYLDFAATIWNLGPAPLLVEGYREEGQPEMRAWQYFSDANGHVSGRLRVGELHFHEPDGHDHWHFEQFARYSLLDADRRQVVRSEKEAFCLAATDAIDLTVQRAEWTPYSTGLATACGTPSSLWVREVLPTGWGDTYLQTLPGQSFDITNLANGTYYIAIEANPAGVLHERTRSNDTQLRKIRLTGSAGARLVTVAPWHGITS